MNRVASYLGKIRRAEINNYLKKTYDPLSDRLKMFHSRQEAKRITRLVRMNRQRKVVDSALKKRIKKYARSSFGSPDYWPWLVLFTEIRGEFHEGWIPCEYYRLRLTRKLNPSASSYLSFKKSFDHRLFGDFSFPYIVFKTNGIFFDMNLNVLDEETALEKIHNTEGEVLIKKESGRWGKDITFIEAGKVKRDNLPQSYDYLVQRKAIQHDHINAVYPGSVNTLRITTYLDFDATVKVKNVIMRVGTGGTRTDNFKTGGRFLFLDDQGMCRNHAYAGITLEPEYNHPDTGFEYSRLRVTALEQAKQRCIESHYKYPYLRLIGWDVFIDRENNPRLLEWNGKLPGYWPMEALVGPWWSLDEIEKFREMKI